MSSFKELANNGISGLMVYEPGRPIDEVARELGFNDPAEITKLASNENSLGPSPLALKAITEHAAQMHLYPDGGAYYLKEALAAKLNIKPQQLIIGSGSNEIIEFIGHTFIGAGNEVIMGDRAFIVYKLIAAMFGAEAVSVPMQKLTHDLDAMLAAITPRTRIIFIANPNNPTGTIVSAEAIDTFMSKVPDNVIVCFDEAYVELLPEAEQPPTLEYVRQGRNVIVLRTFSKTYGLAGLRVGYAVAPEDCINLLNRIRQPFNVNAMALAAAQAALADDAHVERTRKLVADGLQQFYTAFEKMGLEYTPSAANFVLVKVGQGRQRFEDLKKLGVITRPMDGYNLPDHIRITIGTAEENSRCIAALKKVVQASRL
jgi:histidinol-phosphate aminotransferase